MTGQALQESRSASRRVAAALRLLDGVWLAALIGYVLIGVRLTPFHGDESMQIYASRDYATLFIHGQPQQLLTHPPYLTDSEAHLRILNGSVNRYSIGLAWDLAGMSEQDLPGLWSWPDDYETNLARRNRPSDALLAVARLPSALLFGLSGAVMFALGWQIGGRPLAYLASGLYTLHPALLVNGRRAMQEGAFLCFGLLTVLIAAVMVRRKQSQGRLWPWWAALTFAAGLTLASKHSGVVLVAGAYGWVLVAALLRAAETRRREGLSLEGKAGTHPVASLFATLAWLAASGLLALAILVALSPALWSAPLARLRDLVEVRAELIDGMVKADPLAPTTLAQRVEGMFVQPFLAPVQYFEAAFWADFAPIAAEIGRYERSLLSGLHFGWALGLPLTVLAWAGAAALGWQATQSPGTRAVAMGLLVWLAVTLASLLANPLPWQRYALPLMPVMTLLAGVGLVEAARIARRTWQGPDRRSWGSSMPATED